AGLSSDCAPPLSIARPAVRGNRPLWACPPTSPALQRALRVVERALMPGVHDARAVDTLEHVPPGRLCLVGAARDAPGSARGGHRDPCPHRRSGERHREEEADPAPARTDARLVHCSNLRVVGASWTVKELRLSE